MKLYSYKGKSPEVLPFRIRLDSGETKTNLNAFSDEKLSFFGFSGPFYIPDVNEETQTYFWNGSSYEVRDLTENEIREYKERNIDYNKFWENFIESNLYNKIRSASLENNVLSIAFSEFISLFSDARLGTIKVEKIQKYINILFLVLPINSDDSEELSNCLKIGNLDVVYLVPSSTFNLEYEYSSETNSIVSLPPIKPFESWVWRVVDGNEKWNAPIDYPYKTPEGLNYFWEWNESLHQSNNTQGWILREISLPHSSWTYDDNDGWKPPFEPTISEENTWDEDLYLTNNIKGWV